MSTSRVLGTLRIDTFSIEHDGVEWLETIVDLVTIST